MVLRKRLYLASVLLLITRFLASDYAHGQSRVAQAIPAMGTQARIIAYAENEAEGRKAVEAALDRILEIEDRLSDYDLVNPGTVFDGDFRRNVADAWRLQTAVTNL